MSDVTTILNPLFPVLRGASPLSRYVAMSGAIRTIAESSMPTSMQHRDPNPAAHDLRRPPRRREVESGARSRDAKPAQRIQRLLDPCPACVVDVVRRKSEGADARSAQNAESLGTAPRVARVI